LLSDAVHALWLREAACGRPPPFRQVAEKQFSKVVNWHHVEGLLYLISKLDPEAAIKTLACWEASRGSGKSTIMNIYRCYLAEYVLPFLSRTGIPISKENRNYIIFGRDLNHLKDEIFTPLKDLIITHAPWLRSPDWRGIVSDDEDSDSAPSPNQSDPSDESLRALSDMKSQGSQKWQSFRIDLANGISFRSRTLRQSIRSVHVYCMDMDDPMTEENLSDSSEIKARIQGAILPAIEPGGIFVIAATPQSLGDLMDLCKSDPDWLYRDHPAYDNNQSRTIDGREVPCNYEAENRAWLGEKAFLSLPAQDRRSLWPARLPFVALEQARGSTRQSELKFQREYLIVRTPDDTALVHPDDILASKDRSLSYQFSPSPGTRYFAGVDPSGRKRDDAGFCVGYVDANGARVPALIRKLVANPHLPDGEGEMSVATEVNTISSLYGCFDWVVEGNGFQSVIIPLARKQNPSIRMEPFVLTSNKHTENGWLGLRTLFRTRQIRLPYCTEEDRAITDDLVHQLRGLQYIDGRVIEDPKRKNDIVSALFLFVKATEAVPAQYALSAIPTPTSPLVAAARAPLFNHPRRDPELQRQSQSRAPMSLRDIQARLARYHAPRNR
jgi:hypothetical protein